MSWADGRLLAFDVESTGPDPLSDRIVTASIARVGGGQEAETLDLVFAPEIPVSDGAAEVHGWTTERAREFGVPARSGIERLLSLLSNRDGSPIVAFNARFDLTMLSREARRYGFEPLERRDEPLRVVDPLVLDKWLDRYRKGSRKLGPMCEHYGVPDFAAHESAADALATARLAWVLGKKGQVVRKYESERRQLGHVWDRVRGDLDALYDFEIGVAYEQAVGLQEHFRKTDPNAVVETAWPILPDPATGAPT